jgi:hypothetical protein
MAMRRYGAIAVAVLMLAASSATLCSAASSALAAARADACCRTSCSMPHATLATRCCAVSAADTAAPLARDGLPQSRIPLVCRAAAAVITEIRLASWRASTAIDSSPPPLIVPFARLCSLQI